jgi:thermostable 8-oxoguanine DNA glycosylase
MKESPLYQELVQEGRVEARRDDVLKTVKVRFGKLSAEGVIDNLKLIDDINDLTELFDKALQCRSIASFQKMLLRKAKSQPAH